jgi:uncharacterized membrane protein
LYGYVFLLPAIGVIVGIVGVILAANRKRAGLVLGAIALALPILGVLLELVFYGAVSFSAINVAVTVISLALGVTAIPLSRRKPAPAIDPASMAPGSDRTNGLALASIIVVWFSSLIGLILGHVALGQIKRTGEQGRGMAVTAVSVGWVFTALGLIAGIIVAVVYFSTVTRGY